MKETIQEITQEMIDTTAPEATNIPWRVAKCLDVLLDEINRRWPDRDKSSDGSIGDAAHAENGEGSDHNPWIIDNGVGVVRARDFDVDGIDAGWLAEHLRWLGSLGDARLRNGGYVIYNRRIAGPWSNWAWETYTGDNPHTTHVHLSVSKNKYPGYDSIGVWSVVPRRQIEPIRIESLPRDFQFSIPGDSRTTAWTQGFGYVTDSAQFEYANGRGAGRFVYRFTVPQFEPDVEHASVSAVLTSAHEGFGSDVTLVVNNVAQDTRQVPAYGFGAGAPYSEWVIPAGALISGGLNTIELRVDNPTGLRVFYKTTGPASVVPIKIAIPAGWEAPTSLTNDSAFVLQRVPTVVAPGSTQRVTVIMRNIGTKTWIPGRHKLGSYSPADNFNWGRNRVELAEPVPPGGQAVFMFDVKAPAVRGDHGFRWKMVEERVQWFGPGSPPVVVKVGDVPPGPPPVTKDHLAMGQTIHRGAELVAPNGLYKLAFQTDGNIVLYGLSPTRLLWATNRRAATSFVLQSDGNLVAYDAQGRPAWNSGTRGSRAAVLRVQEDGNLVLYTDEGRIVWATMTPGR